MPLEKTHAAARYRVVAVAAGGAEEAACSAVEGDVVDGGVVVVSHNKYFRSNQR